jgi:NADPH:quinone reductase-like Zn-dependent oxidoreductase
MKIPHKMRAVKQNSFGEIDSMYIDEMDVPKPQNDEALIKVEAFGINRADILHGIN